MEETFERAALLAACSKSAILNKINVKTASTKELRELVNMHNSVQIKHLPILFSKYVSKCICSLIVQHKPSMKLWIHPESIRVCVEIDELSSINNGTASSAPPITLIVLKNIVTGALGLSLDNLEHFFDNLQQNSLRPQQEHQQQSQDSTVEEDADGDEVLADLPENVDDLPIKLPEFRPKTFTGSIGSVFSKSQSPEVLEKPTAIRESAAATEPLQSSSSSSSKRNSSIAFDDDRGARADISTNSPRKRAKSFVGSGIGNSAVGDSEYLNVRHFDSRPASPTSSENSACSISPSQSASQCDFATHFDIETLPFETDNAIGDDIDDADDDDDDDDEAGFDAKTDNIVYGTAAAAANTTTTPPTERGGSSGQNQHRRRRHSAATTDGVGDVKISDFDNATVAETLALRSPNTQNNAKYNNTFDFDDDGDDGGLRYYDRNGSDYGYGYDDDADGNSSNNNSSVGNVKILPLELKPSAKPAEFMNVTKNFLDSAVVRIPDEFNDFDFD